ncbi:anti-sigma factor [Arthrobacter agilis]|uniref:anti-sigma factor domain-containing protein n=1 Tax=Arthrobacter agilis TaxID=37921 RepID=UPI0023665404|nr:anti-sigma factor [Arthrobacter agilis]WDF32639.1 anti-sigma factor [Arthrobacter agilis]
MQHLDPEAISLAAIGEQLDEPGQAHLTACDICMTELQSLRHVVGAARGGAPGLLEAPGPEVWAAIHADLDLQQSQLEDPLTRSDPPVDGWVGDGTRPGPGVVALRPRSRARRPSRMYLVAAAAAGVLIGGAALWAVQAFTSPASQDVLAETVLEPLDGFTAEGTARVVSGEDGNRLLDVRSTTTGADGYEEVWLIAPGLDRMYSLGVLWNGTGSLTIPDSVDLAEFPVVDISDEPLDGDPVHSGVSILRGTLTAASGEQLG